MRRFQAGLAVVLLIAILWGGAAFAAPRCYVHPQVERDLARSGTARVIVSLWDPALPQARALDWRQRIPAVHKLAARAMQQAPKFRVRRRYSIFPFLAGSVDREALAQLAASPLVESVYPDHRLQADLAESGPLIGQPEAEAAGATGSGVAIAILDTGVDYTHPDLGGSDSFPNSKVVGGYDFVNDDSDPMDDNGHGTHVASIAAGTGSTYRGIAPGADLVALKVLDSDGYGYASDTVAAIEWCITNRDTYNIRVLNLSLGVSLEFTDPTDCDDYPESQAIADAVAHGMLVTVSSGNDSFLHGISLPACASAATSVGATYDADCSQGNVDTPTDYSDRGELLDLFAPGAFITAAKLGGGYITYQGTSMAAPHVAGAAAVLAQEGLTDPAAIEQRLKLTGVQIVDPDTHVQTPRVDLAAALDGPPTAGPDLVVQSVSLGESTVGRGDSIPASITIKNNGTTASDPCQAIIGLSKNAIPSPQDYVLGTIDVPALAPGAQSAQTPTVTVPDMPAGMYHVIAFADSGYAVAEKDETNNGLTGESVRVGYTAVVAESDIPEFMVAGETYPVSITMKNDGDCTWTAADGFRLAATSPDDNNDWGLSEVPLPGGASVPPGGAVTFDFNVIAPADPGWHPCHWRMKKGAVFFGETATGATRVLAAADTAHNQRYPAVSDDRVAYEYDGSALTPHAISVKDLSTGGVFTIPDDVTLPRDPLSGDPLPPYEEFDVSYHLYPSLSGSWLTWIADEVTGYVAQYDQDFTFYQVEALNLNTPNEYPIQVTHQNADALLPAVDGGRIVWEDYRNDPDGLAFYSHSTEPENPDIYIWDPDTQQAYPLCTAPDWQMYPRISGDLVVWEDWRNGQADIYLYDLSVDTDGDGVPNWKDDDRPDPDPAETRLTDTSWYEITPDISGHTVVYGDLRRDSGLFEIVDIYALDLDTMTTRPVCTGVDTRKDNIRIDGTKVVWNDYRYGVPDVYWVDLSLPSPQPQPLAASQGKESSPDIEGRRLVYAKYRDDYGVWNVGMQELFTHGSVGIHTFTDVDNLYWAWSYVEAVAANDVVHGFPDGSYQPELVVTRDQMAVYLARGIAGGDAAVPTGPATPTFSDVPADYWAYKYIEYCADPAQDVAHGFGDGTYRPALPVDRGAMAVFVGRARAGGDSFFDTYTTPASPSFPDVTAANEWAWCYPYVEYLKSEGVVSGYPDGLYHPETECTRAQMAVYVARAFGY